MIFKQVVGWRESHASNSSYHMNKEGHSWDMDQDLVRVFYYWSYIKEIKVFWVYLLTQFVDPSFRFWSDKVYERIEVSFFCVWSSKFSADIFEFEWRHHGANCVFEMRWQLLDEVIHALCTVWAVGWYFTYKVNYTDHVDFNLFQHGMIFFTRKGKRDIRIQDLP